MTEPATRREDLPDGTVRIHLAAPVLEGDQPRWFFDIRRPTMGEQLRLGDPLAFVTDDRAAMPVVNHELVLEYARVLIKGHDWEFLSRATDLRAGHLIEQVILDFFRIARTGFMPSPAPSQEPASASPKSSA